MIKYIYAFNEGQKSMKDVLGGKGANLSETKRLGLPVPDGFIVTTTACIRYLKQGKSLSTEIKAELIDHLASFSERTGKIFSSDMNLLLVSVGSGARISMPGMVDTILNLGLNDENVERLAEKTGDKRLAYDCYRRLLQMFDEVVYSVLMQASDTYFEQYKKQHHLENDVTVSVDGLKEIYKCFKEMYVEEVHQPFPQEPLKQLEEAIETVFKSWGSDRARIYQDLNGIPHDIGTAVNIQEMVFGNSGDNSGTGVAFIRNPVTGENKLLGEYLLSAQGEDVVAGIHTPKDISALHDRIPEVHQEFVDVTKQLEKHYKDMQDTEFTIENRQLYLLQTRNGKYTTRTAIQIAIDLVNEDIITKKEAMKKAEVGSIDQLLHPNFDESSLKEATVISKAGLPASPGAATGQIVSTTEEAKAQSE